MTTEPKKAKAKTAPKSDAAPETKTAPKSDSAPETKGTPDKDVSKAEGSETAATAPSSYSRGEGQKPVTAAYKENWNAIFAKKTARKKKR
jgi:hypothetical protein